MSNTPARSPLGVFYRSPLGVRGCAGADVYLMGHSYNDNDQLPRYNAFSLDSSGKKAKEILFKTSLDKLNIEYVQTASDGSFVCQGFGEAGVSGYVHVVFKASKTGEVLWTKEVSTEWSNGIVLDSEDNAYALYPEYYHPGFEHSSLMIFDKDGNPINHTLSLPEGFYEDLNFSGVSVDPMGNLVLSGRVLNRWFDLDHGNWWENGEEDYSLVKFGSDRNVVWKFGHRIIHHHAIDEIILEDEYFNFTVCATDFDGNVYALAMNKRGSVEDNNWLVKLSPAGAVVWGANCYKGERLAVDAQGSVYTAGNGDGLYTSTTCKFSSDGILLWSNVHPGNAEEMKVDKFGNLYECYYRDLGEPYHYVNSVSRKYSPSGELIWHEEYWSGDAWCVALSKRISIPKRTET